MIVAAAMYAWLALAGAVIVTAAMYAGFMIAGVVSITAAIVTRLVLSAGVIGATTINAKHG